MTLRRHPVEVVHFLTNIGGNLRQVLRSIVAIDGWPAHSPRRWAVGAAVAAPNLASAGSELVNFLVLDIRIVVRI